MKKFRVGITEDIGGYIEVEAKDASLAETLVQDLLYEYGVDRLFYPTPEDEEELKKYHTRHIHGGREILTCEEINEN
jgi:hypothetical protein